MSERSLDVSREGSVVLLMMQRTTSGNAFDDVLRAQLRTALREAAEDPHVRSVVVGGAGRFFCTGADLKEASNRQVDSSVDQAELAQRTEQQIIADYKPIFELITEMPKPVIAAISGMAAGAGVSLALACDLKVMADDATLMLPFSNVGLITDCGASWSLVRHLGYSRAYAAAIEADSIGARDALAHGLVNRVVPRAEVLANAMGWATKLAERSATVLALTKAVMRHALEHDMLSTFDIEAKLQGLCGVSDDHREGLAAFLERRPPKFNQDR